MTPWGVARARPRANSAQGFASVDPLSHDYPELSPYQYAGNTPIQASDLDGLEPAKETDGATVTGGENGSVVFTMPRMSDGEIRYRKSYRMAKARGATYMDAHSFANRMAVPGTFSEAVEAIHATGGSLRRYSGDIGFSTSGGLGNGFAGGLATGVLIGVSTPLVATVLAPALAETGAGALRATFSGGSTTYRLLSPHIGKGLRWLTVGTASERAASGGAETLFQTVLNPITKSDYDISAIGSAVAFPNRYWAQGIGAGINWEAGEWPSFDPVQAAMAATSNELSGRIFGKASSSTLGDSFSTLFNYTPTGGAGAMLETIPMIPIKSVETMANSARK